MIPDVSQRQLKSYVRTVAGRAHCVFMRVHVHVCVHVCTCVHASVCMCAHVCDARHQLTVARLNVPLPETAFHTQRELRSQGTWETRRCTEHLILPVLCPQNTDTQRAPDQKLRNAYFSLTSAEE